MTMPDAGTVPGTAPLPLPTAGDRAGAAGPGAGAGGAGAGVGPGTAPLPAMTATGAAEAAARFVPPLWSPSTATGGAAVGGAERSVGATGSLGKDDTSSTNYGGGRKLHGKRPTLEGQKSLTPTTDGELDAFAHCLATARSQDVGENELMEETARLYNTWYYTQQLDRDAPQTLRGPTSSHKLRKRSKAAATAKRTRQASAELAAQSAGSTTSSSSTSTSTSTSTSSRPKRRRDARADRDAAAVRVTNRVPLTIEEVETIPDSVAICYLKDMLQSTTGRVAEKRERLKKYFSKHNITVYTPVGREHATVGALVTGPPSGHRAV